MNKKHRNKSREEVADRDPFSVQSALKIINTAQKKSTNHKYQTWISDSSKQELGNTSIKIAKVLLWSGCFLIIVLGLLWLIATICISYKVFEDCSGLMWFNDLMKSLMNIFIFTIVPSFASFLCGKFWK